MAETLCMPNLPQGRVRRVLIGEKYKSLKEPLLKLEIDSLLMPDIPEVDKRLSGHIDLAALHIGKKIFLGGKAGECTAKPLENFGFETELIPYIGEKYPNDAILNACVINGKIIHNRDISVLKNENNFIHVRQGYTKCNICSVDKNAIITSDSRIALICNSAGFDVLKITPGYIMLPGFNTGFIGGCAFKISPYNIAFTGSLAAHPDYDAITDFLRNYNIKPIYLTDNPIFDIGSAILMHEEIS
ncbi:MAG: hypothetical protein VB121_11355 [Enterococcus thailandicus]|nr:hypothetical protein [Enterococcus thailandicus]